MCPCNTQPCAKCKSTTDDFHELKPLHVTWRINEQQRASYLDQLSTFSGVLPRTFVLPSRLSMARYVAGFVDGLSHHFPFIHMPTFSITAIPDAPELVLALMAVGAQYRYERRSATALYHAARAIITERIRRRELPDPHAAAFHHERLPRTPPNLLATTRAILLLAKFAAWQASPALIRESLSYRALLAHSVRRAGLSESDDDDDNEGQMQDDNAWLHWARAETDRRTKLCVFCFLNLQELAFGLEQPVLLANEIGDIRLPSSCREWLAEGQADWLQARMAGPAPVGFRHALACVLVGPRRDSREEGAAAAAPGGLDDDVPVTSPFGNFILVHALLQRITLARQLALPSTTTSPSPLLRPADVDELDAAFNRWRQEWQRAPESVLDVRRSKDSLAFASTALFGLAHVRLVFSLQASPTAASVYARFQACDAQGAAEAALAAAPPPRRGGPHVLKALLHAVHALNIPVQVGVDYLARCQAFFWSVQHVFCSFECAVFLSRWLFVLAAEEEERDARPLSGEWFPVVLWRTFVGVADGPFIVQRWRRRSARGFRGWCRKRETLWMRRLRSALTSARRRESAFACLVLLLRGFGRGSLETLTRRGR